MKLRDALGHLEGLRKEFGEPMPVARLAQLVLGNEDGRRLKNHWKAVAAVVASLELEDVLIRKPGEGGRIHVTRGPKFEEVTSA